MIPKGHTNVQGSSAIPKWLWSIFLVTTIFIIGNVHPTVVPMWLRWVAAIIGLACAMIGKEKYDKDNRLADWINSKVKKMFRGFDDHSIIVPVNCTSAVKIVFSL